MKLSKGEKIYLIFALLITFVPLFLLPIEGFTKTPGDDHIPITLQYLLIFGLFNVVAVGLPAWINTVYIKDFTRTKSMIFFTIFGTILSVLLGEAGNPVMLIPYGIVTAIYAYSYKHFEWWKVAALALFSGVFMENIANRSPLQTPTIMWFAFMIYPYFWTKIVENFRLIPWKQMFRDLKGFFIWTAVLEVAAFLVSRGNFNIALAVIPAVLAMAGHVVVSFVKAIKAYRKGELVFKTNQEPDNMKALIPLGVVLVLLVGFLFVVTVLTKR